MSEANWFNVFDQNDGEWLTEGGRWSKRHTDAAEFSSRADAVIAATVADPQKDRCPAVLGDFGTAHEE